MVNVLSVSQIESILSGKLFLTKIEIEKTLGRSLSDEENSFLESSPEIIVFPFYGRNYYKLDNELISLTVEGKRAISLLANRSQAIKLGQARTCLHHLAGKSGVSILKELIESGLVKKETPINYCLTPNGISSMQKWLGFKPSSEIKLCLDFSEREFHIGGALGRRILERLVHEGKCQLTQQRLVNLKTSSDKLMTNIYK